MQDHHRTFGPLVWYSTVFSLGRWVYYSIVKSWDQSTQRNGNLATISRNRRCSEQSIYVSHEQFGSSWMYFSSFISFQSFYERSLTSVFSIVFSELLQGMLTVNQEERWKIEAVQGHSWLCQEIVWMSQCWPCVPIGFVSLWPYDQTGTPSQLD